MKSAGERPDQTGTRATEEEDAFDEELNWYLETQTASGDKLKEHPTPNALEQLRIIINLGWPICVEEFSGFLPGFLMLAFYGRTVQADAIAGAGMGLMFGNVTGKSIIIGFAFGLPPLVSQAFGAKSYVRCGELLQKQLAFHMVVIAPLVGVVWFWAESILLAAGQPPAIAKLAGEFLRWQLPAVPAMCITELLSNFLKAQEVMVPGMLVVVAISTLGVGLAGFLILPQGANLGFIGGPIALTVASWAQAACLMLLTRRWLGHPDTWPCWSFKVACQSWGEMVAYALPSAFMLFSEWWAWETMLFLAGLLCADISDDIGDAEQPLESNIDLAPLFRPWSNFTALGVGIDNTTSALASSMSRGLGASDQTPTCIELEVYPIVSNAMLLAYFLHAGYSCGAGSHVGNLLGQGDYNTARLAALINIALVFTIGGSVAMTLLIARDSWSALFSSNEEVQVMVSDLIPYVATYIIFDTLGSGALNYLLRAVGIVNIPAVTNVVSFYGIGIPLGVWLTFGRAHWGIFGLWTGLVTGTTLMVLALGVVFLRIDWAASSEKVRTQALGSEPSASAAPATRESSPQRISQGRQRKHRHMPGVIAIPQHEDDEDFPNDPFEEDFVGEDPKGSKALALRVLGLTHEISKDEPSKREARRRRELDSIGGSWQNTGASGSQQQEKYRAVAVI